MKRFIKLIMLACLLVSLVGCHGKQAEESVSFEMPEEFDTTRTYEISFWAKNDSNKTQVEVYKKAIEDFEKYYPNVKVNLKLYTDYTRIYNDVITNISTNTTPNVCITYPDHIATYLTGSDNVVNLGNLIDDEKYGLGASEIMFDAPTKEEIIPEFLDECYISNELYALPYMRSTEALYINKDLVEKLGYEIPDVLTWDFVWEVCEAAMVKDDEGNYVINGQKTMIPFIYKSTDNMMISMLQQLGTGYSDENGNVLMFNDDTKAILKKIGEETKLETFSTFKISSYPGNFLNAGQCIFAVDSTAGATWMGSEAPLIDIPEDKIVNFETVVRPIPQYDASNPKMISQGPSICVFNKEDSQEVLAAWLFAQYLLTNDVQCSYSKTEGYVPVTSKAQNDESYARYLSLSGSDNNEHYSVKIDAAKLLLENTSNTFVTPVFNGSASLRIASGELIENTCKAVRRNKEINDAYFDELFDDMISLYRLDQTATIGGQTDLGPLPKESKVLLISLVSIWTLIGAYYIYDRNRSRH